MIQIVALGLLALLVTSAGGGTFYLSSTGYTSGYQGAQASYAAVKYNKQLTKTMFGTSLNFDPDQPTSGMPNLVGEMSNVFVPRENLGPAWVPSDWIRTATEYIRNPVNVWEWELSDSETNTTSKYRMEEWQLKWYVSLAAQWDGAVSVIVETFNKDPYEWYDKLYGDTQIWFELDLTPIWYFEGQTTAYFAIAKITLSDIAFGYKLNSGEAKEGKKAEQNKVNPESEGSYLSLYYGLGGSSGTPDIPASEYRGRKLNPDLFTKRVYTYVGLNNFGTRQWTDFMGRYASGDTVTFGFNVHVFVIGQWDVQDIQDLQNYQDYGKTAQFGAATVPLSALLSDPRFQALVTLLAAIAVFLILVIVAPGFVLALFAIFMGGKRRR